MEPDLAIVHCPVGGGHKAAALALAEAASARGLRVVVLDAFEHSPRVLGRAYLAAHLTVQGALPALYDSAYFGSNHRDGALEPIRRGVDHLAWAGLVRRVVALSPRGVVATHHLPLVVLGRARRMGRLAAPLVGVVTDYGTHAVWAEKGVDALCVPRDSARREAEDHGFRADRVHVTGIPVRAAFAAVPEAPDPLRGELLRVLVTSGGFGVGPVGAIVQSFAGVPRVELTVVCGRAEGLVARVRAIAARTGVKARVLGYERDMPSRVAEAHLVVGKAGGLTTTEAMTAGRPMIIAGATAGNEAINAELVVSGGAGVMARPREVGVIADRLRAVRALAAMGASARRLVVDRAADRVLDVALRAAGGALARARAA